MIFFTSSHNADFFNFDLSFIYNRKSYNEGLFITAIMRRSSNSVLTLWNGSTPSASLCFCAAIYRKCGNDSDFI